MKVSVLSAIAIPFLGFASAADHLVHVAQGGLSFSPNSIKAAVGDTVTFEFDGSGHDVAQGSFAKACQPYVTKPFYSGSGPQGKSWRITIKDTKPKAFYCAEPHHCQAGMVGVINPAASGANTLASYKAAAAKSGSSKKPAKVQGGTYL